LVDGKQIAGLLPTMQEIKYHNCFICGDANPVGLQLSFDYEDEAAFTWFDSPARYEGYEGVIHGGIIAALLDEAMAKVVISKGLIAVTAEMNIKYRQPLKVGQRAKLWGTITLQKSRILHTRAWLADEAGKLFAEATGVYVVVNRLT